MKKRRKPAKRTIDADFGISDAVRKWATDKGFASHLQDHLEYFIGWAKAKAAENADWDQAFMNAIRDDWGNVRKNGYQASRSSALHADDQFADCV